MAAIHRRHGHRCRRQETPGSLAELQDQALAPPGCLSPGASLRVVGVFYRRMGDMRAGLGVALVCFASTLVYCAEPIEGETPRAEEVRANFAKLVSEDKEVKREALLYF
ncbi:uncharacterized protein METZ01_LOCUS480460, partial [marine metagenome]